VCYKMYFIEANTCVLYVVYIITHIWAGLVGFSIRLSLAYLN
jgi:hypothetical protein